MRTLANTTTVMGSGCALILFSLLLQTTMPAMATGKGSLVIRQVDSSRFPTVAAYVTVHSDRGYPVSGLTAKSFQVVEDGRPAQDVGVATNVDYQQPLAAVLALDVSGSMAGDALQAEQAAANAFIDSLLPQDQASVMAFASNVLMVSGFTADHDALHTAVAALQGGGNTALYDALFAAVDTTNQTDLQRRVVILMTNGVNTRRGADLEDGIRAATQLELPVYTIGLGPDLQRTVLNRIADRTGGMSLFAPGPEALQSTYQAISQQMREQHILTYQSPAPRGARIYHLEISAVVGSEKVGDQRSYEATPQAPSITAVSLSDGAEVEGTVPVTLEVSSDRLIASGKMVVNGRILQEIASPPFSFSLNADRLTPGWQEVLVSVVDAAGSEVSRRVRVLVPPTALSASRAGQAILDSQPVPSASTAPNPGPGVDWWGRLFSRFPVDDVLVGLGSVWAGVVDRLGPVWAGVVDRPGMLLQTGHAVGDGLGTTIRGAVDGVREKAPDPGLLPGLAPSLFRFGAQAAQSNGRAAICFSLMFIGCLGALVGGKKAIGVSRAYFRSAQCPTCDSRYSALAEECPACRLAQEQLATQERSLGDFLVQNNLLTYDRLEELIRVSRERGQRLEIAAIEAGVISARELSRARFYLAQSAEMHDRLSDEVKARQGRVARFQAQFGRLLPSLSPPLSLFCFGVTTWTVGLQAL